MARTDVVGSLLRPAFLLEAREQLDAGKIAEERFAEVEDAAVDEALALQAEAGLDVVTDGEMRRLFRVSSPPPSTGLETGTSTPFSGASGEATSSAR
jgi:hypothetical protein